MLRAAAAVCAFGLIACSSTSASNTTTANGSSAKSVAYNQGDFPDLKTCPESGTADHYLAAEQTANPDQYTSDKAEFDAWKAQGATEIYVVVDANAAAGCGVTSPTTPDGKLVNLVVIHFKDAPAAATSFKTQVAQYRAGTSAVQGAATGLGDNSISVSIELVITTYIAFWQHSAFEVLMLAYGLPADAAKKAALRIDSRIR